MLIAALATGAQRSVYYIREEYPLAHQRVKRAIQQMRERGLLGDKILGFDFSHDIVLIRGAGSYVCGEETGLIASAEGQRGMPKIKPPFPAQAGVFNKPTNVNNVETYANVPLIFRYGAQWYRSAGTNAVIGPDPLVLRESPQAGARDVATAPAGTRLLTVDGPTAEGWFAVVYNGVTGWVPGDALRPANTGTKMFTVSGHVQRVVCVEVPLGTPTSTVVNDMGGGVPRRRTLKGIQPGGALGGLYPAEYIDMTLEPDSYREKRVLMGSGGLVVMDDSACIIDMCIYVSGFGEDESCGRCTTCHGGSQRMNEILRRIAAGGGRESDFDHLRLLGETMRWANCVHGQATPTAILNSLQYFMDEYVEHVFNKRCPAKVCPALIRYQVGRQSEAVAEAAAICPTDAIVKEGGNWVIDQAKCIKCNACYQIAPHDIRKVDAFAVKDTEVLPAAV
jgi:NADH-quinone oxidoreductase subunit F